MNRALVLFAAVFAFSALPACASAPDDGSEEETATDDEALSTNRNNDYFIVTRHDNRRCVSPLCGGVFVKQVNKTKTRCADGRLAAECYVGTTNYRALGLPANQQADFDAKFGNSQALVRATLRRQVWNGSVIGKLDVVEAWEGASGAKADGTFYRIGDNGVRCITTPCPSTSAFTLNSTEVNAGWSTSLNGTNPPASRDEINAGTAAIGTRDGVLVSSGGIAYPRCAPNTRCGGPIVMAEEFYLRVKPAPTTRACGGRAGNTCTANEFCKFELGAICGWADAQGTCAPRPQMCTREFMPVCGCDGRTYSNQCEANAGGTSIQATGACP